MAAFNGGIARPQQKSAGNFKQSSFDRLVTITGYDASKGLMYATDDKSGKHLEVFVDEEQVKNTDAALRDRNVDTAKINWMGHKIDSKMEKHVPVGSKVILLRSVVTKVDKERNLSITEVNRIKNCPNPEPDKTKLGILSVSYRIFEGKEIISHVYDWDKNSIDIEYGDKVEALKNQIDAARANYGTMIGEFSVTEPTIGVQFQTVLKTDRPYALLDNRPIYETIDSSTLFHYIPGESTVEGEAKAKGHVLTGDEMVNYLDQYIEHVSQEFKDQLADLRINILPFKVYPASRTDALALTTGIEGKDKNVDKNPLYQLAHRRSFVDMENSPEGEVVGRLHAVNGIVQISGNKLEKVNGKPVEIPSYWVTALHANNPRGHVHSFVRGIGPDGLEYKVEPHAKIQLIKEQNANTNVQQENQAQVSHQNSGSASSAPLKSDGGFNAFETNSDEEDNIFGFAGESAPKEKLGFAKFGKSEH